MLTAAEQGFVTTLFAYQLARADLEYAIGTDTLDELLVPDIIEPPTVPEMPSLSTPEQAPPIPEMPGIEGQLVQPTTQPEAEASSTELPSEDEDGGPTQ